MQDNINKIKEEIQNMYGHSSENYIRDSVVSHLMSRIELFEQDYKDYLIRFNINHENII